MFNQLMQLLLLCQLDVSMEILILFKHFVHLRRCKDINSSNNFNIFQNIKINVIVIAYFAQVEIRVILCFIKRIQCQEIVRFKSHNFFAILHLYKDTYQFQEVTNKDAFEKFQVFAGLCQVQSFSHLTKQVMSVTFIFNRLDGCACFERSFCNGILKL